MAHPNEELVRRGYEAFSRADVPAVLSLFGPDIVWHVPGRSLLAGDYNGPDGVLEFFGKLVEMTAGSFRIDIHDVLATDDHVVALVKTSGTRNGTPFTFDDAHIWHVQDGRATEFWGLSTAPYEEDAVFS